MVKGMLSFVHLAAELKNVQHDMTVDGSERYPSPSELHDIFTQIPAEWMDKALQRRGWSVERRIFEIRGESGHLCGFADGSALSGDTLIEREVLTKIRLVRDYFQYQAIIRITTNTISSVNEHSNKIADAISVLPAGSMILADPEYDVEENYRDAEDAYIELQVKQKKIDARKSGRKAARGRFDKKKYRKRKLRRSSIREYQIQKGQMLL